MSETETVTVSHIRSPSEIDFAVPEGFSFFQPYLRHSVKETLGVGGQAYLAKTADGSVSGLFIYDDFERTGTVYTRSRGVFEHFYEMKPLSFLWSEMKVEHESETYDIYAVNLVDLPILHSFKHQISVASDTDLREVEKFMALTHPGTNPKWVLVALKNGDKCLFVKLQNEIVGIAWFSLVNGIGRLFSLFVKPQYRRMGIGEDLLFARLLWLRSMRARSAFSEIARNNLASARISMKGSMKVAGQVYEYHGKNYGLKRDGDSRAPVRSVELRRMGSSEPSNRSVPHNTCSSPSQPP